jgi:hypothetical protein
MKKYIPICLLILTACSSHVYVYSDHDPQTDVSLFSRYRWLDVPNIEANRNPIYYNELNDKRIKSAVNMQLQNKGYTMGRSDAEFIVHYHIIVKEKGIVYTEDLGYCYSKYWMDERRYLYQYSEGTLIIDVMNARTNDLIWRGWAVSAFDFDTPADIENLMRSSVDRIFTQFPYSIESISPEL